MDQETVVHLHSGILRSRKKEGAPTLHDSMDGTREHYAKWNKSSSERPIWSHLQVELNQQNKQASKEEPETLK